MNSLSPAEQRDVIEAVAEVKHKPWRGEIILIAGLLLAVTVLGWIRVANISEDVRESAIAACQAQNIVRVALRDSLQIDKQVTAGLPPDVYRDAIGLEQDRVLAARDAIQASLTIQECQEVFAE